MSQEYIEITEKTVEQAITTACQRLSVTSKNLDYIVIQREKSGFLGIGAKPAIIKARVKEAAEATQAILNDVISKAEKKVKKEAGVKEAVVKAENKEHKKAEKKAVKEEIKEEKKVEKAEVKEAKKSSRRRNRKPSEAPKAVENSVSENEQKAKEAPKPSRRRDAVPNLSDEKIEEIKKTAHTFLEDVFKAMEMEVEISEDYNKETAILTINMEGDDMGVLIGKRGQTLDSLQYLVSLVINKGVDGYIHVKADTENYRERRKKTLENLAKNVAAKVKRTRQSSALEPMNPYERRIIHSALQGEKYVTTYSEGEEPNRKVIVALKTDENGEFLLKEEENTRGRNGRRGGRRDRRGRDNRRDRRRTKEEPVSGEEAVQIIDVQAEVDAVISEMSE